MKDAAGAGRLSRAGRFHNVSDEVEVDGPRAICTAINLHAIGGCSSRKLHVNNADSAKIHMAGFGHSIPPASSASWKLLQSNLTSKAKINAGPNWQLSTSERKFDA
ncbi:hypothetical protein ABW21_db0202751 [Orbilia brochopaga]|nr:hypothetical protein ABW21_db0202751 [Drechslerella brochopaga]